ncbi:Cell wall protein phiA [Paramyrothecium foliicola]|nr:Cell wall protein phiA [Paramyrothecium foliicola]
MRFLLPFTYQVAIMKAFTFASLFAAAAALPTAQETPAESTSTNFQIMALRSASPIHFGRFNAAQSSLSINLPQQNASCFGEDGNQPAVFQYNKEDKTLWLYATGNPRQQIFVNRSGMGQGVTGYVTGAQPVPRNSELEGWQIDETGNLNFDGSSLVACPNGLDGAWSVWVSGVANPGGNENCLGFSARTVEIEEPLDCQYTS